MSMYNDFLSRREELEGSPMSAAIMDGGGAPALDNVPNISSAAISNALNNLPPAMAASAEVAAVAAASALVSNSAGEAIALSLSNSATLIPTVQPTDIAAKNTEKSVATEVNLQILPKGFGSYLEDILPKDIATAAGAFSATMQQINKIKTIPIEKFAQVAATLEVATRGLNLINGTDVPTDVTEATAALELIALGSGPYGTYTFSDFFGCMSGLPYPWAQIQPAIIGLQSNTLSTIYQNLYLALSWKQATASVIPTYNLTAVPDGLGNYNYYYQIAAINQIASFDGGGGYGRNGAATPTATIDGPTGGTLILTIGTTPVVNNGSTTFGKVVSGLLGDHGTIVSNGSGTSSTPPPGPSPLTITIEPPPALTPNLDTIVENYINAANNEIAAIRSAHPEQATKLNSIWNNLGTQLGIEQKARNLGLTTIPTPNDPTGTRSGDLFPYPTMLYSFTDLVPAYSKATQPNMSAQTLEAISDQDKPAGQSIVGAMRAERNKARLLEAGIPTDDSIPDVIPLAQEIALIANGTVANSAPAFPFNTEPAGYFDPETENFIVTAAPVITNPNAAINTNSPANPFDTTNPTDPIANPSENTIPVQPSVLGAPVSTVADVLGIGTPDNAPIIPNDIGLGSPGLVGGAPLSGPGAGGGLGGQGGGPIVPGSLAGSPYTKLIPPSLNPIYTSAVLLPASLPVQAAIEEVIKCNCDCWIQ